MCLEAKDVQKEKRYLWDKHPAKLGVDSREYPRAGNV